MEMPELNAKQKEIAEAIRNLYDPTSFRRVAAAFSFSEALALLIDAMNNGTCANNATEYFTHAYNMFNACMADEERAAIERSLGPEVMKWTQELPAEMAQELFGRIADRLESTYGNIKPGDLDRKVDVSDLVAEYFAQ